MTPSHEAEAFFSFFEAVVGFDGGYEHWVGDVFEFFAEELADLDNEFAVTHDIFLFLEGFDCGVDD